MDSKNLLDIFDREIPCEYKGRHYLVRDNGAILRLSEEGGRKSKLDNVWTFGTQDKRTGYMIFTGNVRVHQVVCTAFRGPAPELNMVVDHIDTNRCNNRPENLHWVTKLENILNNPITGAKIELICGSKQAFLENPGLLYGHETEDPNFTWMRSVSEEEAQRSLKRWDEWAAKPVEKRKPSGKGVGEWIYEQGNTAVESKPNRGFQYVGPHKSYSEQMAVVEETNRIDHEKQFGIKDSLTPGAKQLEWKTPTEFLLCPLEPEERSLQSYLSKLVKGELFSKNQYAKGGVILDTGYNPLKDAVYVLTYKEGETKPWALCEITLNDGFFVHKNYGSFFQEDGGLKNFTLAMDREWSGGEVLDDCC